MNTELPTCISAVANDEPVRANHAPAGLGAVSKRALRVLHLEDDGDYVELVRSLLEQDGFAPEVVWAADRQSFQTSLEQDEFDLILADYLLPNFNGLQALELACERRPEVPFLLVSGTIGEEAAIQSLKTGATDYVLKHWPERLAPAVRRAVQEAQDRARRLHAETELVRRESYFRSLTENALDIVTILDREGIFRYTSPSATRVLGYRPEELMGQNTFALIHPEDVPKAVSAFQYGLQHPALTITLDFRFRHRDGSWRYLEAVGQNRLNDPQIAGVVVNSRDISERKREEHRTAALSKLGQRLSSASSPEQAARIIGETAEDVFGWDAFSLCAYCEETDKVLPILSVDTIQGQHHQIPPAELTQEPTALLRRVIASDAQLILKTAPVKMSPDLIPFGDTCRPSASLMFVPIRNRTRVIGILSIQSYKLNAYDEKDLTALQTLADHCGGALERIRAEEALRDSERRFRHLFENSPDAIFVENFEGTVMDVNPAACHLQGLSREELIGKRITELAPPDRHEEITCRHRQLVQNKLSEIEATTWTTDGRVVPVEIRTSHIDYNGRPALLLHVRDITERKAAEEALKLSERRFHSVWENSADGMRLTDEQGIIISVNAAFCKLVGMPREELEGQPLSVLYAGPPDARRCLSRYQHRFQTRTVEKRLKRRMTVRSGKTLDLEVTNSFVELAGQNTLLLGLFRDITEQKRLEEQLRQSQKMEAIGQLAGGVAHDFNNILTVIHGHASLLLTSESLDPELACSAQQIAQSAERAASLTRQLLTFSRRQVMQPKCLDLNEVVGNLAQMLNCILDEHIALQFHYSAVPPLVHADASMIEQIVLNLVINARDAMPQGGQLAIKIAPADVDAEHLRQHPEAHTGRFVCLSVIDTGSGIPPENLRRIFDPFFTTKEIGKGTGLGLATVYGIVQQHAGWIQVSSEVDKGSTFQVFLPAGSQTPETGDRRAAEPTARGGKETVLIVEDESSVRDLVSGILARYGYRVLQATSGVKALDLWPERKDEIDLLLTDMVMPDGMTGRQLAERLQADKPQLKVIFTSGYSADIVGKDFVLRDGLNFLQKPYHPHKLARTVRECLDAT